MHGMNRTTHARRIALLAVFGITASLLGCKAHGTGSGTFQASTAAGAELNAEAKVNIESDVALNANVSGKVAMKTSSETFQCVDGQLDYKGEISFEYNDHKLARDAATVRVLKDLHGLLVESPALEIHIEGHADSRGSDRHNEILSDQRAQSIRQWLIKEGIDAGRLSAKGYGEDRKESEPPECRDLTGPDALHSQSEACQNNQEACCLTVWAITRKTALKIEAGQEQVCRPVAAPSPEPAAEPTPEPVARKATCRWPLGFHLNLLGPNSYAGAAIATEPCVWWLELSLGLGYRQGSVDDTVNDNDASADFTAWTVPFRGRFWFSPTKQSFLVDLGLGVTKYAIDGSGQDAAGLPIDLDDDVTTLIAHGGIGYGYRGEGSFRLALLVGSLFHAQEISPFSDLSDPKPYGEVSFGFLF